MSADATKEKVKRPASQYYWGEWLSDKDLQSCSLPARGMWHEMNCLMHQCEPYGHLYLNGKPMQPGKLANLVRVSEGVCKKLLAELEEAGVFSRDAQGAIFSRRMVRDEQLREARAAGGHAGAEHGAKGAKDGFKGGRPKAGEGGSETPLAGDLKPPPSSSTASASSPADLLVDADASTPAEGSAAIKTAKVEIPDCPHQKVLELWAEVLPAMPQHTEWNTVRQAHLRARWREKATEKGWTNVDEGLKFFRKLFGYVGQSAFLTGKVKQRDASKPPFLIELEWLLLPSNWAKVIEGKYHQEA